MGRIPACHKGELHSCDKCGFWYGEYDSRLKKQDDKWVCRWCVDTLTEKERKEQAR